MEGRGAKKLDEGRAAADSGNCAVLHHDHNLLRVSEGVVRQEIDLSTGLLSVDFSLGLLGKMLWTR